jgi:hypothetical protein
VIPEGSRIQGFKGSSANAKELQRVESLSKVIQTLFRDIYNNSKIPKGRKMILKEFHRACKVELF